MFPELHIFRREKQTKQNKSKQLTVNDTQDLLFIIITIWYCLTITYLASYSCNSVLNCLELIKLLTDDWFNGHRCWINSPVSASVNTGTMLCAEHEVCSISDWVHWLAMCLPLWHLRTYGLLNKQTMCAQMHPTAHSAHSSDKGIRSGNLTRLIGLNS